MPATRKRNRANQRIEEVYGIPYNARMAVVTHNTVPFLVARVATLMNPWHADFKKLGLSVLSVRVMAVLGLNGSASVGELAEATSIDQSTLSHILRRLARARLVEKTRQTHDNRSVRIS